MQQCTPILRPMITSHTKLAAAPLIVLRGVTKEYPAAAGTFTALTDVDLTINRGEFAVVMGESGSGKSTLLGLLAGIDRPTRGDVVIGTTTVSSLSERAMSSWRGNAVGIVFQFFQLLPTLTVIENVMLPMDFCNKWSVRDRKQRALALLDRLGVADQSNKFPTTLSGGQQQRVAVSRAMANEPEVLLADEPTGNLDSRTSETMLELLSSLVQEGQTLVMVTHEQAAQRFASRTITLADGRVVGPQVVAVNA